MISFDDPVGPYDITSVREIQLDNGNILRAFREDPFGFIKFKLDKGQLPDWMKGNYTNYYEADKAVQQYLSLRQMEAEELSNKKFDKKEK